MDTNDWAYYAHCSRLKTKRTKRRLQQRNLEKKLIGLAEELLEISAQKRNVVYEDLDPPYQRGWKRTFILRPDLRNLVDAQFFNEILEKINTIQLSHRKDFKIKRRRFGRKVYTDKIQQLRSLDEGQFQKANFTEKEKRYFELFWEYHTYWKVFQKKYAFIDPWRYVLEVSPNMVTKVRVVDTSLIQREMEVEAYVRDHNLAARMWKLKYGYYGNRNNWNPEPKAKYKQVFKTEPVRKLIKEIE